MNQDNNSIPNNQQGISNNGQTISNNINTVPVTNPNNSKGFGKELIKTWLFSILILILILIIGIGSLLVSNIDLGSGWEGFGNAILFVVVLTLITFISTFVYIIIRINKIINQYFQNYKKSTIYIQIIIISILILIVGILPIYYPLLFLLASTIILIIDSKTLPGNNKPFIILAVILIALAVVFRVAIFMLNNRTEYDSNSPDNVCEEYITSTDDYVYCEAGNKVKRISMKDGNIKFYGKDITYHKDLVYDDYIIYANTPPESKNMDLYALNAKTGESKKIKTFDELSEITINVQNDNAYFQVLSITNDGAKNTNYVYNLKNKKLVSLDDAIYDIKYVTDNTLYYCKDDVIITYDNKQKKDISTNKKCTEDLFSDQVGDENAYYNQYRFLIREGKLYVYDALDSTNNTIISDDNTWYYYVYNYNDKVYIFSKNRDSKLTNVSYYDFEKKSLVDTGLSFSGTTTNSLAESNKNCQVIIKDNVIYYNSSESDSIYSYDLETKENKKLIDDITSLEGVKDGYVYYLNEDSKLMRYNLKNKSKTEIK